ncbi:MAG: tRNA 2-thiouridine(34) synthase MnmA, partial [bacterium]|nr:tRNA 2-thiouridine(34) synthase MnmA [bacterium]
MNLCVTEKIDTNLAEMAEKYVVERSLHPRRIVVAMSGGVDSSVAAWLLKEAGHDVIGVSLRLAPDDGNALKARHGRCCSVDDMTDARRVCERLGLPFYAIDSRERFKNVVFDPFINSYRSGQTPIPCLACNHDVKFGDLYQTAKSLGADLATGHYARVVDYAGVKTLARPDDLNRDQTYYLYGTDSEVLQHLELPLGELEKPFIRALARRIGLLVHDKPDSHEICFVPDGDHAKVVERAGGAMPKGEMQLLDGTKVAEHDGVHHFTIGQRRGIGVGIGERSYVVDINAQNNVVTLGPRQALECTKVKATLLREAISLKNWPQEILLQIRARQKALPARWELLANGDIEFTFLEKTNSVALGQAAVAFDGDVLLGGGIISGRLDGVRP